MRGGDDLRDNPDAEGEGWASRVPLKAPIPKAAPAPVKMVVEKAKEPDAALGDASDPRSAASLFRRGRAAVGNCLGRQT